ncbi:hypothetical protein PUN28_002920 [Cardiocondyla obscurior]|uniref:Uncharacterized protein n=1 Tax=Cardiocondyla obscurior TaxID=286306 RepID=A0AAW2GWR4_9HYME
MSRTSLRKVQTESGGKKKLRRYTSAMNTLADINISLLNHLMHLRSQKFRVIFAGAYIHACVSANSNISLIVS